MITVLYFNPNIYPEEEFLHRIAEQKRLIAELPCKNPVSFEEHGWQQQRFYVVVRGLEEIREGGERCFACYRLRLEETARLAAEGGYGYFTTTLSVSPYKNAVKLNEIGEELAEKYGVAHLPSDFKKKDGYRRSIELSEKYGLYRQNYCGCIYSRQAASQSRVRSHLPTAARCLPLGKKQSGFIDGRQDNEAEQHHRWEEGQ